MKLKKFWSVGEEAHAGGAPKCATDKGFHFIKVNYLKQKLQLKKLKYIVAVTGAFKG